MKTDFITGQIAADSMTIPVVTPVWNRSDVWNTIKVRWAVGRMKYRVHPGIYAVGLPGRNARVFVTANFKLSFDHLRRALDGMNAWILVLDTRGINVWCAAGKGTFGTKELVRRIRIHHLDRLVDHRKLILPQLGATGVAAHEVKRMTGFSVIYGPVRARDITAFLEAGLQATPAMRTVTFPLADRLKLVPVELSYGKYYLLAVPAFFLLAAGFNSQGYSFDLALRNGGKAVVDILSAYLAGCALTPVLLPWIPFRPFALKGLLLGWLVASLLAFWGFLGTSPVEILSWFLLMGGLSAFMAMNFTGSSTFTSLSGVKKELKFALPAQIAMVSLGLAGWIVTRFIA